MSMVGFRNALMKRLVLLMLGAALVLALGPSISMMLGKASGTAAMMAQMEVCTAAGPSTSISDGLTPASQDGGEMAQGACALCYIQCHSPALPEAPQVDLPVPVATHLLVLGSGTTIAFPSALYQLRHSRAPPALA